MHIKYHLFIVTTRILLNRQAHIAFLKRAINQPLPSSYGALYASLPWICFWVVHSLDLLDYRLSADQQTRLITTLKACQDCQGGGFGGGPGQLPHMACTYAAVAALACIGTEEAFQAINRDALWRFLWRMKQPDGSFSVHVDGEADVRGVYCALAVAQMTIADNDNTQKDEFRALATGCAQWLKQGISEMEGGWGAVPGAEAHAGYTYCGLAALNLLQPTFEAHNSKEKEPISPVVAAKLFKYIEEMQDWPAVVGNQDNSSEWQGSGGMRGRTHKLVDGCYSFWGAALIPMFDKVLSSASSMTQDKPRQYHFNPIALQRYILVACQEIEQLDDDDDEANSNTLPWNGGLRDKPGKMPDYYHTCYCLSGLSIAQSIKDKDNNSAVYGHSSNRLPSIRPEYNLRPSQVAAIKNYFAAQK